MLVCRGEEKRRSWGDKKKKEKGIGVFYRRRRRGASVMKLTILVF